MITRRMCDLDVLVAKCAARAVVIFFLTAAISPAFPHAGPSGNLIKVAVLTQSAYVVCYVTAEEALLLVPSLDEDKDQKLVNAELEKAKGKLAATVASAITFSAGGKRLDSHSSVIEISRKGTGEAIEEMKITVSYVPSSGGFGTVKIDPNIFRGVKLPEELHQHKAENPYIVKVYDRDKSTDFPTTGSAIYDSSTIP
jgi:hypothetical protein